MRYLGIDYGSKNVGIAISDESGAMGFPHSILSNTSNLLDELCTFITKEGIGAIVIGESRKLSGEENQIAKDAKKLGALLGEKTGLRVFYESEVFTSIEARRAPAKTTKSRARKTRARIDSSSAAIILTSFLSRKDHG